MIKNKKNIVALVASIIFLSGFNFSYADTFVDSYYRSDSDANPYNNYSFPGNTNPYTGKTATGKAETYLSNYYGFKISGSEDSLLKTLNSESLRHVFIVTPQKSESEKLLEDQKTYFDKLDKERSDVDKRLYELRQQTTIFSKCVDPTPIGCFTEGDYSRMSASYGRSGATEMSQNSLASCRAQIDTYQAAKTQYDQCKIKAENDSVNSIVDKEVAIARLQKESDYYRLLLAKAQSGAGTDSVPSPQTNSCNSEHGQYSVYSRESNQCKCQSGMAPDSLTPFQCIPIEMFCKIESGAGATNRRKEYLDDVPKIVNCTCVSGYKWNDGAEKCEADTPPAKKSMCSSIYSDLFPECADSKHISLTGQEEIKSAQPKPQIQSPEQWRASKLATVKPSVATTTATKVEKVREETRGDISAQVHADENQRTVIQRIKNFFLNLWK